MTIPRQPDALERLAKAYFSQALDTALRLLALTPHGHRHRVLLGLRLALEALSNLSEDELQNPSTHDARLATEVRDWLAQAAAVRQTRGIGPSQSNSSEGS